MRWPLLLLLLFGLATIASGALEPARGASPASCLGRQATIVSAAPRIVGTKAPDSIVVRGGGRHSVQGLGGNDRICGGSGSDSIDGGRGVDRIDGGGGDDAIIGHRGPDRLSGGEGNDFVDGEQGSDRVAGGAGDDLLAGDKGNDEIDGGAGNDQLGGGAGDDGRMQGGPGTDLLQGDAGSDRVDGGPGDGDVVRGDSGADVLAGGPGALDIVSFSTATRAGVEASLITNTARGDGEDQLSGFEDVVGSPQGDQVVGDAGPNRLDGGLGDDVLIGGGGGGKAFGGPGSDTCSGSAEEDSCGAERAPSTELASVTLQQSIEGSGLIVQGGPAGDQLRILEAGGAWIVVAGAQLVGGDGCANQPSSPGTVICQTGLPLGSIVVTGGAGDDILAIDSSVPATLGARVNGNGGSDRIEGGAGDDVLEAGENFGDPDSGSDVLAGSGGTDVLYADPGGDALQGGAGNDLLVSSVPVCQGHAFDGGPGRDTVSYARSRDGVQMPLGGLVTAASCAAPDRILASNESLEGSEGADVLIGDNRANSMLGHSGADLFKGRGGADFLDAADGARDRKVDCGGGEDEANADRVDPRLSC